MRIRIDDLPEEGRRFAGTIAAPDGAGFDSGPISFALRVRRDGQSVHVDGWLHAIVVGECSRCLSSTRIPVAREMDLEYRPLSLMPDDEETELDDDDLDVDYYAEDGLDLRTILAEQVVLGLPMKILCTEDCLGLCPQCGVDRNQEPCDCEPPADPRLADLADLRDRL